MDFIFTSLQKALALILAFDGEVFITVWTSLYTSLVAIVLAAILAIPFGALVGISRFPGRGMVLTLSLIHISEPTRPY